MAASMHIHPSACILLLAAAMASTAAAAAAAAAHAGSRLSHPTTPLAPTAGVVRGTLRELTGHRLSGAGPLHHDLYIETADRQHVRLVNSKTSSAPVAARTAHLQAGTQVEVGGRMLQQRGEKHMTVDSIRASGGGSGSLRHRRGLRQAQPRGSAPTGQVSMIVFIMDLTPCGTAPPATTPQNITNFFANMQPQNLAGMYAQCSMGVTTLNASSTVVLNVPFPCSGNNQDGTSFTVNTCDNNNLVNWHTYAAQYAVNKGISLGRFQHRVIILPQGFHNIISDCGFDALSSQGRWAFDDDPAHGNTWGYGLIWICGDCWNWAPTWFHEIGHNYGVMHARNEVGPLVCDTCDFSSTMGSWSGLQSRCHDAPQMWTMGWSSPSGSLDASTLVPGQAPKQLITLPLQQLGSPTTGFKLFWSTNTSAPAYVFSVRANVGVYDRPLYMTGINATQLVVVHRIPSAVQYTDTALVGYLLPSDLTWWDTQSLLSASVVSWTDGTHVTMAFCRRVNAATPCYTPTASLAKASGRRALVSHPQG